MSKRESRRLDFLVSYVSVRKWDALAAQFRSHTVVTCSGMRRNQTTHERVATIARIALVGTGVLLATAIGFVVLFHYSVVRPAAVQFGDDPDAEFAAELAAVTLQIGQITSEELDDDAEGDEDFGTFDDDEDFLEYLKQNNRSCSQSWKRVAKCYRDYRRKMGVPISAADAREEIEAVGIKVASFKKRLAPVLRQAKNLRAKTQEARALKREVVELITTLRAASFYEYLIDEDKVPAALVAVEAQGEKWVNAVLGRNPDTAKILALPSLLRTFALADFVSQPETERYARLIDVQLASADNQMDDAPCPY